MGSTHKLAPPYYWETIMLVVVLGTFNSILGAWFESIGKSTDWMTSVCTYAGPWHHQVWPSNNFLFEVGRKLSSGFHGEIVGYVLFAVAWVWCYPVLSMGFVFVPDLGAYFKLGVIM